MNELNELLFAQHDGVATITFNRPTALNAFRRSMFQQLLTWLDTCTHDDAIRVVLLTGAGRAFSAGVDLHEVASLLDGSLDGSAAQAQLAEMQELTRRMVALPKPIIAAINGVAVGVGAEIAIASDIRLASTEATFAFAEVKRGLFETNGVMHRLPRLIGMGRAMHVLLTGETISAQMAHEMGLVTQVHAPEALLDAAQQLAHLLTTHAPISLRLVKQVLHQSYALDLEAVMELETAGMIECLASTDLREGLAAFAQKRAPRFTGK